jgi:hypothetical protein
MLLWILLSHDERLDWKDKQYLPWIARDKHLGESQDISSFGSSFFDISNCLVHSPFEIVPHRLCLDGGNFDGLGRHFKRE